MNRVIVAVAGLAALTWLVYFSALQHDYTTFDDPEFVSENEFVQAGLRPTSVRWALTSNLHGSWIPLTWLSLMLDSEFLGPVPGSFHFTNVFLHSLNVLLLFTALCKLTGEFWCSLGVAALFAVHPLHVESVAWITERKDVLSLFFTFSALLAYVRYVRRPTIGAMLLVALLFLLGLATKPTVLTFPCVLLLLDVWPLQRVRWNTGASAAMPKTVMAVDRRTSAPDKTRTFRQLLAEKLPLFALTLFFAGLTVVTQRAYGYMDTVHQIPFSLRMANAISAYGIYLRRLVWPTDLAVYYPHPAIIYPVPHVWLLKSALISGVVLAIITGLALRFRRTKPYLLVGWLWYLGALFPVIGVVQSGHQQMADRYAYLPMIGIYIAVIWLIRDLSAGTRTGRVCAAVVVAAAIAGLASQGAQQVSYWKDSRTLYAHALAVTDRNYEMLNDYAATFEGPETLDLRTEYIERALEIDPKYMPARMNIGLVRLQHAEVALAEGRRLRQSGDREAAARSFERAREMCDEAVKHFQSVLADRPEEKNVPPHIAYAERLASEIDSALRGG